MFTTLIWGITAGLNRASWGAYKDSPYEGFSLGKYLRTILISIICAYGVTLFLSYTKQMPSNPIIIISFAGFADMLFFEIYKLFFRVEKQDKYDIPSEFNLLGKKVNPKFRPYIGVGIILFCLGLFAVLFPLRTTSFPFHNPLLSTICIGLLAGGLEAFCGAWKDAPFERFKILTFLRSPLTALFWSLVVYRFSTNEGLLLCTIIGFNRMTIELYKTFGKRKKPGKFSSALTPDKKWLEKRNIFVLPYTLSWIIVLLAGLFG
jgi:hypothetical protein